MKSKFEAQKVVSSDGIDIFYWITHNKDTKKEFKLLHPGAGLNHSSLEKIEKGLNERGFPTIILDPRGSGYSGHPVSKEYFKLDRLTEDIENIVKKEGIEKPGILSHSFGFMPSIDYAVKSSNVKDIVGITSSHSFSETAPSKLLFHLFDKFIVYSEFLGSAYTLLNHKVKGEKRKYCDQSDENVSDIGIWLSIVDIPFNKAASHVIGQRECNKWDVSEQLSRLDIPVLLIYGDKDKMVKSFAGDYIKNIKNDSEIEIINGDHSLPMKKPYKVLEVIDKYNQFFLQTKTQ